LQTGKAIFEILSTDPALVTLLGGKDIFPSEAPQETALPYIVYNNIQVTPSHTKTSTSTLDVVRMQIDVFAKRYSEVQAIEERVRVLLDYFEGTVNGVNIDSIWFHDANEILEDELNLKHTAVDYNVRLCRAATAVFGGQFSQDNRTWKTQIETNQTVATIIATNTIPTDIDNQLEVYRDGRLLAHGEHFTISGQTLTFDPALLDEDIIIKTLS